MASLTEELSGGEMAMGLAQYCRAAAGAFGALPLLAGACLRRTHGHSAAAFGALQAAPAGAFGAVRIDS